MYPDDQDESLELSRRELLASAAFVPLVALAGSAPAAAQATPAPSALSADQMRILEAFVERLIPHDELGPSAAEGGAQIYIDRSLAGPNAAEKGSFTEGLAAMDAFAKSSQGAAFAALAPDKR